MTSDEDQFNEELAAASVAALRDVAVGRLLSEAELDANLIELFKQRLAEKHRAVDVDIDEL